MSIVINAVSNAVSSIDTESIDCTVTNGSWATHITTNPYTTGGSANWLEVVETDNVRTISTDTVRSGYMEVIENHFQKENQRMLYEIFIVNPEASEGDEIIHHDFYIAKSKSGAEHKALQKIKLKGDVEDYDFIVRSIGDVRTKREVQEVKVVE